MKVWISGATGLIGAHSALALLKAGHQVKLLVRNAERALAFFTEQGFTLTHDDLTIADMTDGEAVKAGMHGCDAVLHCAAVLDLSKKNAKATYATNIKSIEAIIGGAHALGINNIVYVSSLSVFAKDTNKYGPVITEQTPLTESTMPYAHAKTGCERLVRQLQAKGAPIQIVYPSAVYGPYSPNLNITNESVAILLNATVNTTSGIQFIDARDLAYFHRLLLENPPTGDMSTYRFIAAGDYYAWPDMGQLMERITERHIFKPVVPRIVLECIGHITNILPINNNRFHRESIDTATRWVPADSSNMIRYINNVAMYTSEQTLIDTIRWLYHQGHIDKKSAGAIVNAPMPDAIKPLT